MDRNVVVEGMNATTGISPRTILRVSILLGERKKDRNRRSTSSSRRQKVTNLDRSRKGNKLNNSRKGASVSAERESQRRICATVSSAEGLVEMLVVPSVAERPVFRLEAATRAPRRDIDISQLTESFYENHRPAPLVEPPRRKMPPKKKILPLMRYRPVVEMKKKKRLPPVSRREEISRRLDVSDYPSLHGGPAGFTSLGDGVGASNDVATWLKKRFVDDMKPEPVARDKPPPVQDARFVEDMKVAAPPLPAPPMGGALRPVAKPAVPKRRRRPSLIEKQRKLADKFLDAQMAKTVSAPALLQAERRHRGSRPRKPKIPQVEAHLRTHQKLLDRYKASLLQQPVEFDEINDHRLTDIFHHITAAAAAAQLDHNPQDDDDAHHHHHHHQKEEEEEIHLEIQERYSNNDTPPEPVPVVDGVPRKEAPSSVDDKNESTTEAAVPETETENENQPSSSSSLWTVGDVCLGRWNDEEWYQGRIVAAKNGIFEVHFDDGDVLEGAGPNDLRRPDQCRNQV